jgi:hypothetical protein
MNKKQKKVAVGVGAAALAAAAAGTYFLAGKRGAKNRAAVSKWAGAAKQDVVKQLKGVRRVTKQSYGTAVNTVLKQYKQLKKASPAELLMIANELKGQWDTVAREVGKVSQKVTSVGKKPAAKKKVAPKKSAKKSTKKRQ